MQGVQPPCRADNKAVPTKYTRKEAAARLRERGLPVRLEQFLALQHRYRAKLSSSKSSSRTPTQSNGASANAGCR